MMDGAVMLIVKGSLLEATKAAERFGIATDFDREWTALEQTVLIARCDETELNKVRAWFQENGYISPPFPTGTLLYYFAVDKASNIIVVGE